MGLGDVEHEGFPVPRGDGVGVVRLQSVVVGGEIILIVRVAAGELPTGVDSHVRRIDGVREPILVAILVYEESAAGVHFALGDELGQIHERESDFFAVLGERHGDAVFVKLVAELDPSHREGAHQTAVVVGGVRDRRRKRRTVRQPAVGESADHRAAAQVETHRGRPFSPHAEEGDGVALVRLRGETRGEVPKCAAVGIERPADQGISVRGVVLRRGTRHGAVGRDIRVFGICGDLPACPPCGIRIEVELHLHIRGGIHRGEGQTFRDGEGAAGAESLSAAVSVMRERLALGGEELVGADKIFIVILLVEGEGHAPHACVVRLLRVSARETRAVADVDVHRHAVRRVRQQVELKFAGEHLVLMGILHGDIAVKGAAELCAVLLDNIFERKSSDLFAADQGIALFQTDVRLDVA